MSFCNFRTFFLEVSEFRQTKHYLTVTLQLDYKVIKTNYENFGIIGLVE